MDHLKCTRPKDSPMRDMCRCVACAYKAKKAKDRNDKKDKKSYT